MTKLFFLFREFLQLFIKPEDIRESNKQLQLLDLTDTTKHIPTQHLLTGECESILKECSKEEALIFRKKLLQAFVSTGQYMQKKLPLGNTVLSTLSLLDPLAFGQADTAILLKKLSTFFPTRNAPNFN
ncbi:hypothetical protein ElyMa_000121800 [Elysia marginata]|uniref:Uncharacterized protein n=1 Tax=Elysia marginata TaxID=1093978 RepID=A0AAV4EM53_9GAST|nr:hypothetical protein ElyMa_000121800 [Elysia marginata]